MNAEARMTSFAIQWGESKLEYDRDYGVDGRRGWTAVVEGIVAVQFVSLRRALCAMAREARAWRSFRRRLLHEDSGRRE